MGRLDLVCLLAIVLLVHSCVSIVWSFVLKLYDGKAFCFPSLQNGQDILGSYFRCRNEFEIEPSVFESLRAGNFSVRNSLVEVRHSGIALHTTTS